MLLCRYWCCIWVILCDLLPVAMLFLLVFAQLELKYFVKPVLDLLVVHGRDNFLSLVRLRLQNCRNVIISLDRLSLL